MPEQIKQEGITENQAENQTDIEKKHTNSNDIYMQSDIVDQLNYNQQSNMTLSAYSVITQSFSTVKINISNNQEVLEE